MKNKIYCEKTNLEKIKYNLKNNILCKFYFWIIKKENKKYV